MDVSGDKMQRRRLDKHTGGVYLTVQLRQNFVLGCGVLACQVVDLLQGTHRSERSDGGFRRSLSSGGRRAAYRGRVVSQRLQVSDVGVDKPPRALDVHAHVVVGSIGDGDSHAEVYQSPPAEGGTMALACV